METKIGEELATQLAQASQVASSRSNRLLEEHPGRPKWAWLRNLTGHNFTDCVTMFPFDFRHVSELHVLCNKGCQVPRSGQTKAHGYSTCLASSSSSYSSISVSLRSLTTRPPGAKRLVVHVDPATGKADGPHMKKLRTYLGIVARDKVYMTYETWKEVSTAQKDLIWEDIQAEFDIPEASDSRTKKKILQTFGEQWRQFKSDLMRKWALAADKDRCAEKDTSHLEAKQCPHVLSCGGYEYLEQKMMAEKTKKKLEEAAQSGSTEGVIDPPSPIRRHVKSKMAHTKKIGQMTSEAAKETTEKIDSLEEQASQGLFVPHGLQDLLTAVIGRPEHPGRVRATGSSVTIKQYFGLAPRSSRNSSSMAPEELEQLTKQIRDQLEESIMERPEVGPSAGLVSIKGSCVDPSSTDPDTGDSDKCRLYIKENPSHLEEFVRDPQRFTTSLLLHDQVKVGVEEVKDAEALIPVPTDDVILVGQTINTFLAWPTHLVKRLSEQLCLQQNLQIGWIMRSRIPYICDIDHPIAFFEASLGYVGCYRVHGHEDLSKIPHSGQCLSIFVIQLWILGHWQMVVILPKENLVVWFCSLHNRPDNYLKGIINSALKGLDDTPQPKSKAGARWIVVKCNRKKGSTECDYYVMHWMSTIFLGSFRNNWETYFNDVRSLEAKRLKAFHIQWAQYYLKVRNQT
ncbi:hypothetical protein HKD37_11G031874 [Glycine soja]